MENNSYLTSVSKQFKYYKVLAERAMNQLTDEQLSLKLNDESNSISIIVKHIVGNMLSRFTNFLTEDGEKEWREREQEFSRDYATREEMMNEWNSAWDCLFAAIKPLEINHLEEIVYIRNEGHTITEALNRQLSHYAYHVGQIVYIGKMVKGKDWVSLSIPIGQTKEFNESKFIKAKGKRHHTDGFI